MTGCSDICEGVHDLLRTMGFDIDPTDEGHDDILAALAQVHFVRNDVPASTAAPEPWIWLQDSEDQGRADCGCRLVQNHEGSRAAVFYCAAHNAAPELLAALEGLLATEDDPSDSCHWCGDLFDDEGPCTAPDCPGVKARAAIDSAVKQEG